MRQSLRAEDSQMVLRIDDTTTCIHGNADMLVGRAPGFLLRSVFVALIVATTIAVAGLLSPGTREARIFDPRCEYLDTAAAMRLAELMSDRSDVAHIQVREG